MRLEIPIFYRFEHEELKKVVPSGIADDAFLQAAVENTNWALQHGHKLDHRETHNGSILSNEAFGYSDRLSIRDGEVWAETDLGDLGTAKYQGGGFRSLSAGVQNDFTTDDGTVRPGPYFHHVAWLGTTKGKIKSLDLKRARPIGRFSEQTGPELWLQVKPETNEFALFSEQPDRGQEEDDMSDTNAAVAQLEARLSERDNKITDLEAKFSEISTKVTQLSEENETLKAENATLKETTQKAERDAKFAEIAGKLNGAKVGKSEKEALLADAREAVDSGSDVAVKVIENTVERRVRNAEKSLPGGKAEFAEEDGEGEGAPDLPKITAAHFSEEAYDDRKKGAEVMAVVKHRRLENEKFTVADLRREVVG